MSARQADCADGRELAQANFKCSRADCSGELHHLALAEYWECGECGRIYRIIPGGASA